jgi:cell division septum initiation protein DivIVA
MNRVKNEMSGLLNELKAAKDEVERQKLIINNFASQESALKDALLTAHQASEEVRANAMREADAVVQKAHRTAEETQRQYQAKINDLRWELERMRMDKSKVSTDFRAMLEGYLRNLSEEGTPPANGVPSEPSENIRAAIDAPV